MQFYQKRTAQQQENRLPQELRQAYRQSQIDRITISANGKTVELTGYAEYSYLEEKAYKTQPVRTNDGKINEIEEYETFLTPRLVIKYNMMHIDDYRETMKLLKTSNGFIVRCYDPVENKRVVNEMYVAPTSMPKIYQQYLITLGIQDFSIELIGTNRTTDFSIKKVDGTVEEFYAPLESKWSEFINNITSLDVSGDYIVSNSYYLHKKNGSIVSIYDYIIDGENYYLDER